jgi:hypothetical protein
LWRREFGLPRRNAPCWTILLAFGLALFVVSVGDDCDRL